jgi:hypothetical protein
MLEGGILSKPPKFRPDSRAATLNRLIEGSRVPPVRAIHNFSSAVQTAQRLPCHSMLFGFPIALDLLGQ